MTVFVFAFTKDYINSQNNKRKNHHWNTYIMGKRKGNAQIQEQGTQCTFITNIKWLKVFKKTIIVCFENHTKTQNVICAQNVELLNFK
jgi:hypothetical protein